MTYCTSYNTTAHRYRNKEGVQWWSK